MRLASTRLDSMQCIANCKLKALYLLSLFGHCAALHCTARETDGSQLLAALVLRTRSRSRKEYIWLAAVYGVYCINTRSPNRPTILLPLLFQFSKYNSNEYAPWNCSVIHPIIQGKLVLAALVSWCECQNFSTEFSILFREEHLNICIAHERWLKIVKTKMRIAQVDCLRRREQQSPKPEGWTTRTKRNV